MAVVTISRQFGAGGSSVANLVAAELHAEVVDKRLIEEVARRLGMAPSEVEAEDERPHRLMERLVRSFSTLEPAMGSAWSPPYPDPLFDPTRAIVELTEQVIREVAGAGNVVIVGRGAGFCLHERKDVVRVYLHAPEAVRRRVLIERLGVSEDVVARKMHEMDSNRAAYIKQLYKHEWRDPAGYDLTINTGSISYPLAAEMILMAVREHERSAVTNLSRSRAGQAGSAL